MSVRDSIRGALASRWSSCALAAVAGAAAGCWDKIDVVDELPCIAGSTRPECAPEAGPPGGAGGGGGGSGGSSGGSVVVGGTSGTSGSGGSMTALPDGDSGDAGSMPVAVPGPPLRVATKLDLLFMIDNSRSMRDKQNVLGLVNTSLITALASPPCVPLEQGVAPVISLEPCPEGQTRAFHPITDIHIGVITSSLGDAAANAACPSETAERDDKGWLLGRLPRGQGINAASDIGFLRWNPELDPADLTRDFQLLLQAVGETGCGWEMSLESWYRFLIDPYPYRELVRVPCPGSMSTTPNCAQMVTDGENRIVVDDELLAQRQQFLRPDSLVAIVMLTDENDCSITVHGSPQSWVVTDVASRLPMFRASSMCDTNPNNPCCYNCQLGPPEGCPEALDPVCAGDPPNRLPPEDDGANLRCFDQRRRFGYDFMYPTARYVNALKLPQLCWSGPSLELANCSPADYMPNPLYASGERTPDDVFLAGIVGVPWQDLAASTDARGNPLEGDELRFKSAAELGEDDWRRILGDPHDNPPILPSDPYMRESSTPRPEIASGNAINGREFVTSFPGSSTPDDLEYACIFRLPTARDCSRGDPNAIVCDCVDAPSTPLCEDEPGITPPTSTQYWGKAYPGLRQLDVLRGYGENSVVASICARKAAPEQAGDPDFAYRPALNALMERIQQRQGAR